MSKQGKFLTLFALIVVIVAAGAVWRYTQGTENSPPSLDTSQELLQGKIDKKDLYYSFNNGDVNSFKTAKHDGYLELKGNETNYVYFSQDMMVSKVFESIDPKIGMEANLSIYNQDNNCLDIENGYRTFNTKSSSIIKANCVVMINVNAETRIGDALNKPITERQFEETLNSLSSDWALVWTATPNEATLSRIAGGIESADFTIWTLEDGEFVSSLDSDTPVAWIIKKEKEGAAAEIVVPADSITLDFSKGGVVNDGENIATVKNQVFASKEDSFLEYSGQLKDSDKVTMMVTVRPSGYEGGSIIDYGDFEINYDSNNGLTFTYGMDNKKFVTTQDKIVAPNEWYFVVGVYEKGVAKLYVNGELVDERIRDGALNSFSEIDKVYIGRGFDGEIANARLYNKALSAAEVAKLAEGLE